MTPNYSEVSVYFGAVFIVTGISLWVGQYVHQHIFTDWTWAVLYGSLFVIPGYLLLFSDVRVYMGEKTMTEELIADDEN